MPLGAFAAAIHLSEWSPSPARDPFAGLPTQVVNDKGPLSPTSRAIARSYTSYAASPVFWDTSLVCRFSLMWIASGLATNGGCR